MISDSWVLEMVERSLGSQDFMSLSDNVVHVCESCMFPLEKWIRLSCWEGSTCGCRPSAHWVSTTSEAMVATRSMWVVE